MTDLNRIQVICPRDAVSGGPEALHYLVHELRSQGFDAELCYKPTAGQEAIPRSYRELNLKLGTVQDAKNNFLIYPESMPMEALSVRFARAAIWWLSVDIFRGGEGFGFKDKFKYFKKYLRGERPIGGVSSLKGLNHFSQSFYAAEFLRQYGIYSTPLYEPINSFFIPTESDATSEHRENKVIYNPAKSGHFVDVLKTDLPDINFVPLKNMDRASLLKEYKSAKIYIDFGPHPGRDRIPREAAVNGCVIFCGLRGSACNDVDIPIERRYKLHRDPDVIRVQLKGLIQDVFVNFGVHSSRFAPYRAIIKNEPRIFSEQLNTYFSGLQQVVE